MDRYYLIHETSLSSLLCILKSGYLLTSSKTQKMANAAGQGSKNRRLTSDPTVSLTMPDFYEYYDEVDGVYMRLLNKETSLKSVFGECTLLFGWCTLNQHSFVINTEENFGFMIGESGISQFSGEPGISITSLRDIEMIDGNNAEVLIRSDVAVSFIKYIFFFDRSQKRTDRRNPKK